MLTAAVCDDEKITAEKIKELILHEQPECRVSLFCSGEALLDDSRDFDIVFLDVRMEGIDGMETARKLRSRGSEAAVIFISGLKEYVFDAFEVSALNYLLKPVDEEKFRDVFSRALCVLNSRKRAEKPFIFIRNRDMSMTLSADEIYYLENRMRKIAVHSKKGVIDFYGAMAESESKLGNGFFRCHRGFLVNMEYISGYDRENIYLSNGEKIYMAKERYGDFVKSYMGFLRGKETGHV